MKFAAIDIGTNAVRLLIKEVKINGGAYDVRKVSFTRVPLRLGEDVFETGKISDEKARNLVKVMRAFWYLMDVYGIEWFRVCATSAMREAKNVEKVRELVLREANVTIELINGQEEAVQNQTSEVVAEVVETAEVQVETPPSIETLKTPETAPVAVENGEAAYQAALQTLRSGQYEEAITALSAFPEQYPQSSYLPNAYYWQGEANYVLRHFDLAIVAFQTVIDQFPTSSKVADATLKQGFSQYELGKLEVATATLTSVIEKYPNTSAARLAKVRLDRMKQATR